MNIHNPTELFAKAGFKPPEDYFWMENETIGVTKEFIPWFSSAKKIFAHGRGSVPKGLDNPPRLCDTVFQH